MAGREIPTVNGAWYVNKLWIFRFHTWKEGYLTMLNIFVIASCCRNGRVQITTPTDPTPVNMSQVGSLMSPAVSCSPERQMRFESDLMRFLLTQHPGPMGPVGPIVAGHQARWPGDGGGESGRLAGRDWPWKVDTRCMFCVYYFYLMINKVIIGFLFWWIWWTWCDCLLAYLIDWID